jgi:hypothetical protein
MQEKVSAEEFSNQPLHDAWRMTLNQCDEVITWKNFKDHQAVVYDQPNEYKVVTFWEAVRLSQRDSESFFLKKVDKSMDWSITHMRPWYSIARNWIRSAHSQIFPDSDEENDENEDDENNNENEGDDDDDDDATACGSIKDDDATACGSTKNDDATAAGEIAVGNEFCSTKSTSSSSSSRRPRGIAGVIRNAVGLHSQEEDDKDFDAEEDDERKQEKTAIDLDDYTDRDHIDAIKELITRKAIEDHVAKIRKRKKMDSDGDTDDNVDSNKQLKS